MVTCIRPSQQNEPMFREAERSYSVNWRKEWGETYKCRRGTVVLTQYLGRVLRGNRSEYYQDTLYTCMETPIDKVFLEDKMFLKINQGEKIFPKGVFSRMIADFSLVTTD